MRWWPRKKPGEPDPASFLPAPTEAPSTPPVAPGSPWTSPPKPQPDRPRTFIELLSDLTLSVKRAVIFLVIICVLMAAGTVCAIAVADALKGINFGITGSLRIVLPTGIGVAALLSWLASLVWRRKKEKPGEPPKDDRTDSPDS